MCLIYYNHKRAQEEAYTGSGAGLHRSNAVRRSHRRSRTFDGAADTDRIEVTDETLDPATGQVTVPIHHAETVLDVSDYEDYVPYFQRGVSTPEERNGTNLVQLLFRVSEDSTKRNSYVHRGCRCNSCGAHPIRGIRYRCSNCADYDLCEICEAQGVHTKTHVFYKVRIPTSPFATRQMQPVWYTGNPDNKGQLDKSQVTELSRQTGFDRPEIDAYWEQWTFMANTEVREDSEGLHLVMDRKTFDQCLVPSGGNRHAPPNLIHDRMFAFYDTNKDGVISFPEFLNGLAYRKKKDKLRKVFEAFDINGDGYVDRRDFLRMFRSYYVLYKQMHRDMLDGMDDQTMNAVETIEHIKSRNPLSAYFARDGLYPNGEAPRAGEGKGVYLTDQIFDDKGVLSSDSKDIGNREDVIIDAVVRDFDSRRLPWDLGPTAMNAYWRAMLNPPGTIDDLRHDVLDDMIHERREAWRDSSLIHDPLPAEDQENVGDMVLPAWHSWPPSYVTREDVHAVMGFDCPMDQVPIERQPEVYREAKERLDNLRVSHQTIVVNDEIHERWKRRHFYTDEEEGASAPPDWKEEEDIFQANGDLNGDLEHEPNNEAGQSTSPRPRSSSKVRFAEDTDDYDIRSNLSTSSRSVPERWGGMEIPEPERDAGKEVLYQVTQQACNELLDQLFKDVEDRAVAAMACKKSRDKYRHWFTHPAFEAWAKEFQKDPRRAKKRRSRGRGKAISQAEVRQGLQRELQQDLGVVDLEEVRQRPLEQLLAATGFTIDIASATARTAVDDNGEEVVSPAQAISTRQGSQPSIEALVPIPVGFDALVENAMAQVWDEPPQGTRRRSGTRIRERSRDGRRYGVYGDSWPSREREPSRDPTMPQFRPNSGTELEAELNRLAVPSVPILPQQPDFDPTLPQFRPNAAVDMTASYPLSPPVEHAFPPPVEHASIDAVTFETTDDADADLDAVLEAGLASPDLSEEMHVSLDMFNAVTGHAEMALGIDMSDEPLYANAHDYEHSPRSQAQGYAEEGIFVNDEEFDMAEAAAWALPEPFPPPASLPHLPPQSVPHDRSSAGTADRPHGGRVEGYLPPGIYAPPQDPTPQLTTSPSLAASGSKLDPAALKRAALDDMSFILPEEQHIRAELEAVDWMLLFGLWELERIELEAKERGGWGRLSWAEFEKVIKGKLPSNGKGKGVDEDGEGEDGEEAEEERERRRVMMDYLGSWIEFCIP